MRYQVTHPSQSASRRDGQHDPVLPGSELDLQRPTRARTMNLKAMIANGEKTFSSYANLPEESEALQAWSLRAQRSLEP